MAAFNQILSSFSHRINQYQIALNLAKSPGYGFNEKGDIIKGGSCSKNEVLLLMLNTLKQAPVYYLNPIDTNRFITSIDTYTVREEKKIKKTAYKIKQLLHQKMGETWSWFQSPTAKEINDILDKHPAKMNAKDYHLLLYLANLLAAKRTEHQFFYKKAAIIEAINELKKQCSNLTIKIDNGSWEPIIDFQFPSNPFDFQFLIIIELYQLLQPEPLTNFNSELLRGVVQQKAASDDKNFKSFLNTYLILHGIAALCQEWNTLKNTETTIEAICQEVMQAKQDIPDFGRYSSNYIYEPRAYTALTLEDAYTYLLRSEEKLYGEIAKELWKYAQVTNEAYDHLYNDLYNKLIDYQALHPEAKIPLLPPDSFKENKAFTAPRDIQIPILTQIKNWEREFQQSSKAIAAKPQKPALLLQREPPSIQPEYSSAASSSSSASSEGDTAHPLTLLPPSDPSSSSSSSETTPTLASTEIAAVLSSEPLNLKQALIDTSPFGIDERVLVWFDPEQTPPELNRKSRFVHNFAWVANRIVWDFGFRYSRENKHGTIEPALTILCQGEQTLYKQPRIFRVTFTFDPSSSTAPPLEFDPSLRCYHRALSQRKQEQEEVEKYFTIGKRQIKQLALRPSINLEANFPKELIGKVYPDGSYIESVRDTVITVRDPKNDSPDKPCKLYFFVVR